MSQQLKRFGLLVFLLLGIGLAVHQTVVYQRHFSAYEFFGVQTILPGKGDAWSHLDWEIELSASADPLNGWFDEARAADLGDVAMGYEGDAKAQLKARQDILRLLGDAVSKPRYEPPVEAQRCIVMRFPDLQSEIEGTYSKSLELRQRIITGNWAYVLSQFAMEAEEIGETRRLVKLRDQLVSRKFETASSVLELVLIRGIMKTTSEAFSMSAEQLGFEEEAQSHRNTLDKINEMKVFSFTRFPEDSERATWLAEHSGKLLGITPATEVMAGRKFSERELEPLKLAEEAHLNWRVTLQWFYVLAGLTVILFGLSVTLGRRYRERLELAFSWQLILGSLALAGGYFVFRRLVPLEVAMREIDHSGDASSLNSWGLLGAILLVLFFLIIWLVQRPIGRRANPVYGFSRLLTTALLLTCWSGVLSKGYYLEERFWISRDTLWKPGGGFVSKVEALSFENIRRELEGCLPQARAE